jgi:hypothetical protein
MRLSRNWRHKTLNANKLHQIATLPFSGFSTQRQFLAQVTEPQVLVNGLQELAAQHIERERVVRKSILQVCAFCGKRQFLAQVAEPQGSVIAS